MKYVLITGAYGGMGRAAALALRDAGYTVFALDIKAEEAEEGIIPITASVTDPQSLNSALIKVKKTTDELYAILHFAGIYSLDSLIEITEERWRRIFEINLFGAYRVNKTFLPLLKRGSRVVIATSELAPLDPLPFTGLYAVTKSTLDKYAYSLRMELQLLGIKVIQLRPGAVSTDMLGVSTAALDRFCEKTKYYSCNAKRFKNIVESVEARSVSSDKVAEKAVKILASRTPKYIYKINSNPLLIMLSILPKAMQTRIIKLILK